jgi:hypothetical protein
MALHSQPAKRRRRADDLVERLEGVKADAEARGFGTLAYFIETALIEARLQDRCAAVDRPVHRGAPSALWPDSPTSRAES